MSKRLRSRHLLRTDAKARKQGAAKLRQTRRRLVLEQKKADEQAA